MLNIVTIIALLSFFTASIIEMIYFKIEFYETIPTNFCGLCIFLHFLAFVNRLSYIDLIELCVIIIGSVIIAKNKDWGKVISIFRQNGRYIILFCFLIVLVCVGMRNRNIAGWDDFKFWGAQVKALYYRNGYGTKYTNIASTFGDYPMGTLLIEWWFEHLNGLFAESLLYIGQMIYAIIFLMPLIKKLSINLISSIIVIPIIIAFGTAFTRFGIGLEPDRVMAFAYAGALCSVINIGNNRGNHFYQIQFLLIISSICLMKSIGVVWALAAVIFYIIYDSEKGYTKLCRGSICLLVILLIWGGWTIYCKQFERTAYLTEILKSNLKMSVPNQIEHIHSHIYILWMYLKVMIFKGMNCSDFYPEIYHYGVSLSPVSFIVISTIICVLMARRDKKIKKALWFNLTVCLVYACILLYSYFFMFYTELDESRGLHMQNMTSHYYEPAIVGIVVCSIKFFLDLNIDNSRIYLTIKKFVINKYVVVAAAVFPIINFPMSYVYSFSDNMDNAYYEVQNSTRIVCHEKIRGIVDSIKSGIDNWENSRVLVCTKQQSEINYLDICLMHYEVSPISTIEYNAKPDIDDLKEIIEMNHCNYIYVDSSYREDKSIFSDIVGDSFEYDVLFSLSGETY